MKQPSKPVFPVWWALLIIALVAGAAHWASAPPAAKSVDAPASEFSAHRAQTTLAFLLGAQQRPHPIGSPANARVRDRLLVALEELGLTGTVQRAIGCAGDWPVCGQVENVVAELPGTNPDAIVVMAHYDSVPPSPGAGDDASGVVAVLESVRALQAASPVDDNRATNSIILLFTDGEEVGLLGAEAFFAEHPDRSRVHAVINLEGAGSGGGPALLLRSDNRAGHLLDHFRAGADYPVAASFAQEVFSRMPNDTDFSVASRAGLPSIDFAFASEFNHYHTPLDTLENLSLNTLQHHGENLLPLLTRLRSSDLRVREPGFVYQTFGSQWLAWQATASTPLALLALAMLLLAVWRSTVTGNTTALAVLGGMGFTFAALLLAALLCAALMWLATWGLGTTVGFPANPWPWRLLLYAGAATVPLALPLLFSRRNFWPAHFGLWLLFAGIAVLLASVAPLAANLFVIPTLLAASATAIVVFLPDLAGSDTARAELRNQAFLVGLSLLGPVFLLTGLAPQMEASQGLQLAPAIYLMLIPGMLPLLLCKGSAKATGAAAVLAVSGVIWAIASPQYSPNRPQFVSIHYLQNVDSKEASWIAYSDNPLPDALLNVTQYSPVTGLRFPWETDPRTLNRAAAPWTGISEGQLLANPVSSGWNFTYKPDPGVDHVTFVLPRELAGSLRINDQPVPGVPRQEAADKPPGPLVFRFYAPPPDGFKLTLETTQGFAADPNLQRSALYLLEGRSGLPPSAQPQIDARGTLAVAKHQGDQWLTFRRIVTP